MFNTTKTAMDTEDTDLCSLLCHVFLVIIFTAINMAAMNEEFEENDVELGWSGAYDRKTGEYDSWLSYKWGLGFWSI